MRQQFFSAFVTGVVAVLSCASAFAAPPSGSSVQSVQEVNAPGKNPYQHNLSFTSANCSTTQMCAISFPAVPANKRLVVTYVSAMFSTTIDGDRSVLIGTTFTNSLYLTKPVRNSNSYGYVSSAPVTYYFEAGETPTVFLFVESGAITDVWNKASVIGYLVSLP